MKAQLSSIIIALGVLSAINACKSSENKNGSENLLDGKGKRSDEAQTLEQRIRYFQKEMGNKEAEIIHLNLQHTPTSNLIAERKIADMITPQTSIVYEASGIGVDDDNLYIAIDNQYSAIIALPFDLALGALSLNGEGRLIGSTDFVGGSKAGFEGLTIAKTRPPTMYLLQECKWRQDPSQDPGKTKVTDRGAGISRLILGQAKIEHAGYPNLLPTPKKFSSENKGFEGLANLVASGQTYLFGLCEGNNCEAKDEGLNSFNGTIHIFTEESPASWQAIASIEFGNRIPFLDFSDLDLAWRDIKIGENSVTADGSIFITSQMDSAIWSADIAISIKGHNVQYRFEHEKFYVLGAHLGYCNIEGITELDHKRRIVAVASDAAKSDETNPLCRSKEQSVHILKL